MSALFLQHPRETDLALFAGGESGPFARWRIERHVESCERCRTLAGEYFRLPDQLSELADVPQIDWTEMAARIEAGVENARTVSAPERRRAYVPPLAWQAGLAVAGVAIMLVMVRSPEQYVPVAEEVAPAAVGVAPSAESQESVAVAPSTAIAAPDIPVAAKRQAVRVEEAGAEVARTDAAVITDIAAPAAPPPPPTAAKATSTTNEMLGGRVAESAGTAEQRLRANATASVIGASVLDDTGEAAAVRVRQLLRDAWSQGGDTGLENAMSDFRDDPTPEMQRLRQVFEEEGLPAIKQILESTDR